MGTGKWHERVLQCMQIPKKTTWSEEDFVVIAPSMPNFDPEENRDRIAKTPLGQALACPLTGSCRQEDEFHFV
jgi:hypothetical protein